MVALRADQVGLVNVSLQHIFGLALFDKANTIQLLLFNLDKGTLNHFQGLQVWAQPSYEVFIALHCLKEVNFLSVLFVEKLRDTIFESIWELIDECFPLLVILLTLKFYKCVKLSVHTVIDAVLHSQLFEHLQFLSISSLL